MVALVMSPHAAAAEGGSMTPLETMRAEAAGCTSCQLHLAATQTVFGEGPAPAALMFVGEQPGDQEDLRGRPFVGPAGQVFDRAMAEAGVDRASTYVTNAVKHFKFVLRGKRRIHQKPEAGEIERCRFWLLREIDLVSPQIIIALGATAARALTGRTVTIGRERGRFQPYPDGRSLFITVHPSYLLRIENPRAQAEEYARFVAELRLIRRGPGAEEAAAAAPPPRQASLF
jgi:uracil-DNA glycosylase family protein